MSTFRELEQQELHQALPDRPSSEVAGTLPAEYTAIVERHELLEAMINHVPDFIYTKDLQGRFLFANQAVVKNNGFDHVDEMVGLSDYDIHPIEYARSIDRADRKVMASGEADLGQEEARLKGGGWLMMSRVPLRDRAGNIIGVVGASRDISVRKRAEELMKAQTRLLRDVARGVEIESFLSDVIGLLRKLFPSRTAEILLNDDYMFSDRAENMEFPIVSRDGGPHGALIVTKRCDQCGGMLEFLTAVAQTVGIAIDRNRDVERIAHLAEHDALTGLPNRALLERTLQPLLLAAEEEGDAIAVAFLDLDNFKLVNDSLGHAAGDELLRVAARRIVQQVGENGLVSRIGGDEFIVILEQASVSFRDRLEHVRVAIAEPIILDGVELRITTSIGFACSKSHGGSPSQLTAHADLALYKVKEAGRNGIHMFTPVMAAEARNKLERVDDLRRAIERDEFVVHYQAQHDAKSGAVVGVEALVRWDHPTKGLLSPGAFVPLAEETGLIVAIGDLVLDKACRQAKVWQDRGIANVRVAVNVSARQFLEPKLVGQVAETLSRVGLDPQWLELELTESLIMKDVEGAVARMRELTALGVGLSIDDFGTGYSSLSMLRKFPLSRLKIDRSFISEIPNNSEDMAITNAIISLAKLLKLEVVAEGVETEEQASFLEGTGCEVLQGYLFARPLPAEEVDFLLNPPRV